MPDLRPFVALLLLAACSGPPAPPDGAVDATTPDGGTDSGAMTCGSDMACGDQSLFCMRWRCRPGEPGTDARGCIDLGPPCDPGQGCDEERDMCGAPAWCTEGRPGCAVPGDCDNDGARAIECGGGDCDDEDMQRHPGRTEICDAAAVDEDCNPTTVAGPSDGDGDGDTFTSAECCNGSTCGDDCDDADVNVNPSASEVCDGIDQDCSGRPDDFSSLCPGGVCAAGRCDFTAWDFTFGTVGDDSATAISIDSAGNVYVAGGLGAGTVSFGGPARTVTNEALFVVKFAPDGRYLWDYVVQLGRASSVRVLADPTGSWVYLVGYAIGDLGSEYAQSPFFLILDGAGAYVMDRRYGGTTDTLADLALNTDGVLLAGKFWQTVDLGGGDRVFGTQEGAALIQLSASGTYVRDYTYMAAAGGYVVPHSVSVAPSGEMLLGGVYAGSVSLGGPALTGNGAFVASIGATGVPMWARALRRTGASGSQNVTAVGVGTGGRVYASGYYSGGLDPGTGSTFGSSSGTNGFVFGTLADGTPDWFRSFGSNGGTDRSTDLAVTATGDVLVVGEFSTNTDFGRGIRVPVSTDGFLARYAADGVPFPDFVYATSPISVHSVATGPGGSVAISGAFSGTSDFGSGVRASVGGRDCFVLRLGN